MNVVYTAVFGDITRDQLLPATLEPKDSDTRFFVITNNPQLNVPYPYRLLMSWIPQLSWEPRKMARWYKINSYRVCKYLELTNRVPSHISQTLWHDASFEVIKPSAEIFKQALGLKLAYSPHRMRNCVYKEIEECKKLKLADPQMLDKQGEEYRRMNWPKEHGLYETGLLLRIPTDEVYHFEQQWWEELERFTLRDQISFPVVLEQSSLISRVLPCTIDANPGFCYRSHNTRRKKT